MALITVLFFLINPQIYEFMANKKLFFNIFAKKVIL